MTTNINEVLQSINKDTWIISDTHFGHKNILSFESCRLTQMRIDGYDADEHDKWLVDKWNSIIKEDDTVLHLGDLAFKSGFDKPELLELYSIFKYTSLKSFKMKMKLIKPKTLNEIKNTIFPNDGEMELEQFKSIISNYIDEKEYFTRYKDLLNGNIILVLGNHDPKAYENKLNGISVIDGFYWEQGDILNKVHNPIPNDRMLSGFIKEIDGKKLLFCHYDIFTSDYWDRQNKRIAPRIKVLNKIFINHKCNTLIHGHTHSTPSCSKENSINVSFEQLNFRPQRLKSLL